jgi:oligopeptide/dipeptide ABC transporter ATP-binding protein
LLNASPRLKAGFHYRDGALTEIPGSITSAAGEAGCPFRPRCPSARESCAQVVPPLLAIADDRLVACPFVRPAIIGGEIVAARGL